VGRLGIARSGWYFYQLSTAGRMAAMSVGALVYSRLLILPVSMSADYNFPVRVWGPIWAELPEGFGNIFALLGLLLVLGYLALTGFLLWKKKHLAYPFMFFAITMFPFSNILPFGDFIAERFLYLPSIGFCLFLGIQFHRLLERKKYKRLILGVLIILFMFYSVRTILRNRDWRSGIDLWKAEFRQNPRNPNLYSGIGGEYAVARKDHLINGNAFREKGDFKNSAYHLELARKYEKLALKNFELAIKKDPKDFFAYYNYGGMLVEMLEPDIDRSEEVLLSGAGCTPENLHSLHVFYYYVGVINMRREPPRPNRALEFFRKAHQLKKSQNTILLGSASALVKMGRYQEALEIIRKVLRRDPGNYKAVRALKFLRKKISS